MPWKWLPWLSEKGDYPDFLKNVTTLLFWRRWLPWLSEEGDYPNFLKKVITLLFWRRWLPWISEKKVIILKKVITLTFWRRWFPWLSEICDWHDFLKKVITPTVNKHEDYYPNCQQKHCGNTDIACRLTPGHFSNKISGESIGNSTFKLVINLTFEFWVLLAKVGGPVWLVIGQIS